MVLTNMEADRLNWTDTDKIDLIWRPHALAHILGVHTSASCSVVKKNSTP